MEVNLLANPALIKSPRGHLIAALDYARYWPVLPLAGILKEGICGCNKGPHCSRPGKHPLVPGGLYGATKDEGIIKDWWQRWPMANLGILTGKESGLLVLDVDPRNGGMDSLDSLRSRHGNLPSTSVCATGGDGRHYYFNFPDSVNLRGNVPGYPGLDIKKSDGYVVAPPSRHASGKLYRWLKDWRLPLAPVPEWLLELITVGYEATPRVVARPRRAPYNLIVPSELTDEDHEILRCLETGKHGQIYRLLTQGDWKAAGRCRRKGSYDTASEADLALINKLARLVGDAPSRIKALFLETEPGQQDKIADNPGYLDRTIRKAVAGLGWRPNNGN